MTYKCILTVAAATAAILSPTGVAAGKVRFNIADSNGVSVGSQEVDGLEATFTGLADGTFTASAQQLDANGQALGDPVTTSFVDAVEVPPAPVMFTPLAALSAAVSAE